MTDQRDQTFRDQKLYQHTYRPPPNESVEGVEDTINSVTEHLASHIGKPQTVLHETESALVHVDVHIIRPRKPGDGLVLVTSGMSDREMDTPVELRCARFAELMVTLPDNWPLDRDALRDEASYWPIRWLRMLARFPHRYDTWLGHGHTVPNGDPPAEMAPGVGFSGVLVADPQGRDASFSPFTAIDGRLISIYALWPLFASELEYKLRYGTAALMERLSDCGVSEMVVPGRGAVC